MVFFYVTLLYFRLQTNLSLVHLYMSEKKLKPNMEAAVKSEVQGLQAAKASVLDSWKTLATEKNR